MRSGKPRLASGMDNDTLAVSFLGVSCNEAGNILISAVFTGEVIRPGWTATAKGVTIGIEVPASIKET